MNLYLLTQTENVGYFTYESAVVAAPDSETARRIHPKYGPLTSGQEWNDPSWASAPRSVRVQLLGTANEGIKQGTFCTSFRAG